MDRLFDAVQAALDHATFGRAVASVAAVYTGYKVLIALYNISPLHPLHKFPGPKLAAAGYFYEAYYDWIRGGRYTQEIKRMHAKYGPIVRINPDELHCNDPLFTDEIYASGNRIRDKHQHQLNTGGAGPVSVTAFSTVSHEEHKMKKAPYARFMSRAQIAKLEGEVLDAAQLVTNKMLNGGSATTTTTTATTTSSATNGTKTDGAPAPTKAAEAGVFDVKDAFNCYTADVIAQYAFGRNMGFITQEGWTPNFATWVKSFLQSAYMMRHNALARKLAGYIPLLADYMGDDIATVMRQMNVVIPGYIQAALDDPEGNGRVFAEVVQSKALPDKQKEMFSLSGEGFNFLLAGTETTAAILTVITYQFLSQPAIYNRIMDTLSDTTPATLKWSHLEQKPYFWALVQEALRVMPGVSHRSARIARYEDLHYQSAVPEGTSGAGHLPQYDYVIPRGTPIGMSSVVNHADPGLFPDPDEFRPERWLLEDGSPNYKLHKYLLAFSRGSRSCIGENLAYCEIYLMTALMAIQVIPRATLHEQGDPKEKFRYDHDMIVLQTKKGSISCRISIS
ncbi:benzoate 4-monooxygenase cytochrome P450 [Microdochium bolleyi]|uniref:Benzoate 4-monooxygenase cytochrome P450 n=1 Tax=Microdochium bolleyi TaxID=196109 RepID=A0A136IRL9_9PEZI|nr:benzoate 4-monooxygenase cytochrome P450 [Microdochium bolleyi]